MTYALVNTARTQILKLGARPDWFLDNGEAVPDDALAAGGYQTDESGKVVVDGNGKSVLASDQDGWVPVTREEPEYDSLLQQMTWNDQSAWLIDADRVVQTYTITDRSILDVKSDVIAVIDNMAEGVRSGFLTQGGPGQALEYDQTRREAEEWVEVVEPDIDDFPMLRAEYNARRVAEPSITAQQVVDDTLAEIAIWKLVGSAIKEIRRTAKVAVEVAETREHVKQIRDWAGAAFHSAAMTGQFEPLPID